MRLPINRCLALTALLLLAGCASGSADIKPAPVVPDNGPADDYPMVLGDPFTIEGTTHTPSDVMNYDTVGYAVAGEFAGTGVVASHKTLPLPSYVEITNLETGRTILARLTTRGPMTNDALIGLSTATATELGAVGEQRTAVRVRRVNPPELERSMLRGGEPVPARMDTPASLLVALKRRLGLAAPPIPATTPVKSSQVDPDIVAIRPAPANDPVEVTKPKPPAPLQRGAYVQVGAFSSEANARKAAESVSGSVSRVGKFWIARMGPFPGKADLDAALAKARAAGYGGAIVRRVN